MGKRVYITGIGMICAIGNDVPSAYQNLLNNVTGIGEIKYLETIYRGILPAAEVKMRDGDLMDIIHPVMKRDLTRSTLFGLIAAKEAINCAGLPLQKGIRTGLISATTVGGMNRSEDFYAEFLKGPSGGRLRNIIGHDCADSTIAIARDLGIHDFISTVSTACSSSVNSLIFASNLIKSGRIDRVIAGGTDAITRFTLNGFNTLMILDKTGCHPFDENRAGLTMGEGAAFLVLESEEMLERYPRPVYGLVSGYGNANDAFHQTASSPDGKGALLAMSKALEMSGLAISDIDYINVHGTGTMNNDLSEGIALQQLFTTGCPLFSSTKGYTGHTLGAAGAIESVISVLSLKQKVIFPNYGFRTPMKELNITPNTELIRNMEVRHVLSNSFGFGGNNSSILFSN